MSKEKNPNCFVDYHKNMDVDSIKYCFAHHLKYSLVKDRFSITDWARYRALALSVRDRIIERWIETKQIYKDKEAKMVYYLSMEYLLGRSLKNNLINLEMEKNCAQALRELGTDLEELYDMEVDAGLGNGGLGRLAACFLDSLTSLSLPAMGYGLRYDYGIFRQRIENGEQKEEPDEWLRFGNVWEVERLERAYHVHFGGKVEKRFYQHQSYYVWFPQNTVVGLAYDWPITGYGSQNVNTLRLWSAKASEEFDFDEFNQGDYVEAVTKKIQAENLTKVLYPDDSTSSGKELRFKQQYFFVSCALQDILRRFKFFQLPLEQFPQKVAIQLNDTHPSLAIPELMRLLIDKEGLSWQKAWQITTACCAYTNHTLLPEALEKWPVDFFERLLPRHLQIIYEINRRFLEEVAWRYPGDNERLRRMSLIEETPRKQVRMAYLATVGSAYVNGVAKLHGELLKRQVMADYYEFLPSKFTYITNGITPRRWLLSANPELSAWISSKIGDSWITNLEDLRHLEPYASDSQAKEELAQIKLDHKKRLCQLIKSATGYSVEPSALFDVHIKRLHEYKRQLMNVLHIIMLYNRLKQNPSVDMHPRVFIFAAKAAPGYFMAKRIIKLIHSVAKVINGDPFIGNKLKVIFLPNYGVSLAEAIIPAADLSEQISTAGMEASGTGNMKLGLNGALTIGTLDGANVEMMEEVGEENIFIFGLTSEQIQRYKKEKNYNPLEIYQNHPEIQQALDLIRSNFFSLSEHGIFSPILHNLLEGGDPYFVLADLADYAKCQEKVEQNYRQPKLWYKKVILNIARLGKFSSDRAVLEYSKKIWKVQPVRVSMVHKRTHTSRHFIQDFTQQERNP